MNVTPSRFRFIRCGIGPQVFGIDLSYVIGLSLAEQLELVDDGSPLAGYLDGVAIYWLGELLGIPIDRHVGGAHVIMVEINRTRFGFRVDRVSQVSEFTAEHWQPLSPILGPTALACFHAALRFEQEQVLLLAVEAFHPDGNAAPRSDYPRREVAPIRDQQVRRVNSLILFRGLNLDPTERPITFGLPMERVYELADTNQMISVPGAPEFVVGLALWRDRVVPVLDMASQLGLTMNSEPFQTDRMLVCRAADSLGPVAFLAGASRVLRLPAAHIASDRSIDVPSVVIQAQVELDRETLLVPNINLLFESHMTADSM